MQTIKSKNLIFTADDFGYDEAHNIAVLKAYKEGMLNSCALMTNCTGFEQAIEMLSDMKTCKLGIHLNIIEGKSLTTNEPFQDCFFKIWKNSYDKNYMNFVEKEFRTQIEKLLDKYKINQINSHVHTHAIPNIFELTCTLATEYKIDYIRTQHEHPYFIADINKYIGITYPINLAKVILLNSFTKINKSTLKKYNLQTNDYIIGVNYTGNMDKNTVKYGLSAIKNKADIAEVLLHPCYYKNIENKTQQQHYKEFQIFIDNDLKTEIEQQGWFIK